MNKNEIVWYIILPSILFSAFAFGLYYFGWLPIHNTIQQSIADSNAKSAAENYTLHSMDCKQLGDWLLTDKWYDHENLVWAQNQYLVRCK